MLTTLLVKLLDKKKKKIFSGLCFDNVKLERKNNSILYFGDAGKDLEVSGYIGSDGQGEECFILRNQKAGFRRHKIRKFKTKMNTHHLKSDYFTKDCLGSLVRIRTF